MREFVELRIFSSFVIPADGVRYAVSFKYSKSCGDYYFCTHTALTSNCSRFCTIAKLNSTLIGLFLTILHQLSQYPKFQSLCGSNKPIPLLLKNLVQLFLRHLRFGLDNIEEDIVDAGGFCHGIFHLSECTE